MKANIEGNKPCCQDEVVASDSMIASVTNRNPARPLRVGRIKDRIVVANDPGLD